MLLLRLGLWMYSAICSKEWEYSFSENRIMWERSKELGFTTCAIALACANLVTFIIIITQGIYQIWEPYRWILYLEAGVDLAFIAWGIERLIGDIRK